MNAAMKRARTSGELARRAGRALTANPYRKSSSTRSPRRGSWSEAFARQWALGWREIDQQLHEEPALAVTSGIQREMSDLSYQLQISGHHGDDNATVKKVAEDAVHALRAAGHSGVTLTGYSYNGAERIELSTPALPEVEQLPEGQFVEASKELKEGAATDEAREEVTPA